MHGDEVAIEDAGILHAHADDLQQVVRLRLEEVGIDLVARLDVFLGEDRAARRDPADERQAELLAHGVLQLDAARGAGDQRDHSLAGECAQVLFGGIRRAEAELGGDLRAGGRHAGFSHGALDEAEDFGLAGREV